MNVEIYFMLLMVEIAPLQKEIWNGSIEGSIARIKIHHPLNILFITYYYNNC